MGAALERRDRARPAVPALAGEGLVGGRHDIEALAAMAAWVARYDCGEWDDPPGKLALLDDLQRVRHLVRCQEPF